jgi:hypothetical protein
MPTSHTPQVSPSTQDTQVSHKVEPQRDPPESSSEPKHKEIGGRGGLEPTRFGDWEKNGRCIDF